MSSLRNAIPRRPHKERSQEKSRAKYGLLEKHKDYSQRARDFNTKKARLRVLRQKATDRNPDEFHFAMLSSRTENGVKVADRGNKAMSDTVTKLLKTQDAGYLRTMLNKVRKEKETLEEEIIFETNGTKFKTLKDATNSPRNKHTVFWDDHSPQQSIKAEDRVDIVKQEAARVYNRQITSVSTTTANDLHVLLSAKSPREREVEFMAWKSQKNLEKKQARAEKGRIAKYEAVKNREQELILAEQGLDLQRAKMRQNVGGVNKNGIKFKIRERKR